MHQTALAVVAVLCAAVGAAQEPPAWTPDERNTIEVFEGASPGVVYVEAGPPGTPGPAGSSPGRAGSGFFVDAEGHVVTNAHVVDGMSRIEVVLAPGRRLPARLVGTAPQLDLALLHVSAPSEEFAALRLAGSEPRVGQKVLAIGNPLGLGRSLSAGIVSALGRSAAGTPLELQEALIQTDAAVNPGSSGGPLLDSAGRVLGVTTLAADAQGIAFAVPSALVRTVLADLVRMGHPYQPQLGFSGVEIDAALATLFGLPLESGYLVEEVMPGSRAARAGLRPGTRVVVTGPRAYVLGGDVIVGVGGTPFRSAADMARRFLALEPGARLELVVWRDGVRRELAIPLGPMSMGF